MVAARIPSPVRTFALALVSLSVFAGPPSGHFGGGFGGGFHGGGAPSGGFRGGEAPSGGFRGGYGSVAHGPVGGARGGWAGGARYGGGWYGGRYRNLPGGSLAYRFGGAPYYCYGGYWYYPWNGWYMGCYPPIGLWMDTMPFGYATTWVDGVQYYENNDVYYTDAPAGGYQVAEPPPGRAPQGPPPPEGNPDPQADALLIVPEKGQTAEKMKADRSAAQAYARQKSGYDPAFSDPDDPGTPRARRRYQSFIESYLESKGYSVK